eukprot:g6502.t1
MATRDDAAEGSRAVISTVINNIADGALEVGAATPVVAPLCVALRDVKGVIDGASRNGEELQELRALCETITVHAIDRVKTSNIPGLDVGPLQQCVDKLEEVAKRYHDRSWLARLAQYRRDGDDIQRLRKRLENVVPAMGLAGVVDNREKLDQILALLQPPPELAPVPKKAPVTKSSHVVRDGVVDRVCKILRGDGGPAVAALTGQSGAGKTTSASAMVGERGDRVRALFPNGVVWLRVGKRAGAADRLPRLMLKLAKRVHKDVMKGCVDAPEAGEDGASYAKKILSQEGLECLVVADDVWEYEVVEKLRETGMWVLLTTRFPEFVEPQERVVMDTLMPDEAEDVLHRAAELPPGERLCDAAMRVLKICGRVAMDTAFVGSWISQVEHKRKEDAWARAVEMIEADGGGVNAERADNRLAILRAGFDYLGTENVLAQKLYAELAVFPDGHAFGLSDAAVLLGDGEVASKPVSILERWGVLKADASDTYRMHDAHVDFAREKLMGWETIRKPAVGRWTKHISRLDFAVSVDVYALLRMWRALEDVGGGGWFDSRPYDDQLVEMDASDRAKVLAVRVVAEAYVHDRKFGELEELVRKVLEQCDAQEGDCLEVQMMALYYTRNALSVQGRHREGEDAARRLGELGDPGLQLPLPSDGAGFLQTSTTFSIYGVCARAAGRMEDAEEWFRKALKAQETGGLTASHQAVFAMVELGECAQETRRFQEAEAWFERALEIEEAKLGPDELRIANILYELARSVREAGRPGDAVALFQRALEIEEAKVGPDDVAVAHTLHGMARSVRKAGRPGDAVALFQRALEIKEAKLGPDKVGVADTLCWLALSVRDAGRPGDAVALFQRALEIKEVKLGPVDVGVADTLCWLALSVLEAGRPGDAVALFQRALEIKEAKLGPVDVGVAYTLHGLAVSVREAGRPGDAVPLFQRALENKEAKLGPDDVGVANTLHELAVSMREAGRPGDAVPLFRRALEIKEARLGPDDVGVANTLHELARSVREAGRLGDAVALFQRALEIKEVKLGPVDVGVAYSLHELALSVREAGRPGDAVALFQRALEIEEAKLGIDHPAVSLSRFKLGRCVEAARRQEETELDAE